MNRTSKRPSEDRRSRRGCPEENRKAHKMPFPAFGGTGGYLSRDSCQERSVDKGTTACPGGVSGRGLRRPGPESEPSEGAMRVRRRVTLTRSDPWGAGYPHSSRADAAGQWPMWAPRSKEIPLAPLEKSTVGRADRRRSDGGLRFSWPRRGLRLGETAPRSSRSSPRWKIAGPLLEAPGPVCKTRSNL